MRALIHFPIIHSGLDLGTLNAAANQSRTKSQEYQHVAVIEQFWAMVAATVDSFALDYSQVKLYQDSLPVCGKERDIVAQLASTGSQNYQLLLALLAKGATLMGTESADLLVQEHALMTQQLHGKHHSLSLPTAQVLLTQRDTYIAQRINDTLQENEMGLLFLGLMHDIEKKLSNDIVLLQPLGKLTELTIKT